MQAALLLSVLHFRCLRRSSCGDFNFKFGWLKFKWGNKAEELLKSIPGLQFAVKSIITVYFLKKDGERGKKHIFSAPFICLRKNCYPGQKGPVFLQR